MRSEFLKIMQDRGFLHQCTDQDGLDQKLNTGIMTCYVGYDATAKSLHIGSLLSIMMLRWFQKCGHKPIVLMGGGTSKVGDPSGKDESRKLLTADDIAANISGIRQVFAKYLSFGNGKTDAVMVNNAEWLDRLNYIDFLRDYGRHFTINRMMTFDSVKTRLEREQPLTFLEFNYMILQAYDFLELNRKYNCTLQMGGSDQWGNIVNGIELARRVDQKELYGLTCPLITTSSGAKMGKSANGAIWLNSDMCSSYDFYQYWRNVDDADVGRFLKIYTELPLDEITRLETLKGQEINEAKKILAFEATKLCHGELMADMAEKTAQKTFEQGDLHAAPRHSRPAGEIKTGVALADIITGAGLAKSNSEVRRKIEEGAVKINGQKIDNPAHRLSPEDIHSNNCKIAVSVGKKNHAVIVWE